MGPRPSEQEVYEQELEAHNAMAASARASGYVAGEVTPPSAARGILMTTYPIGTRIYYLSKGKDGRKTLNRPDSQQSGAVTGTRDIRGAYVQWDGGHWGSVLWDWIDDKPPHGAS
jgi:hypothetical protein